MASNQDTFDERTHFFTSKEDKDKRGQLFSKALKDCKNEKLSESECDLMREIVYAKEYDPMFKKKMNDEDIHNDFTDFLVKTALYHREIDTPTTSRTVLSQIEENNKNYFNAALTDQYLETFNGNQVDMRYADDNERQNRLYTNVNLRNQFVGNIFEDLVCTSTKDNIYNYNIGGQINSIKIKNIQDTTRGFSLFEVGNNNVLTRTRGIIQPYNKSRTNTPLIGLNPFQLLIANAATAFLAFDDHTVRGQRPKGPGLARLHGSKKLNQLTAENIFEWLNDGNAHFYERNRQNYTYQQLKEKVIQPFNDYTQNEESGGMIKALLLNSGVITKNIDTFNAGTGNYTVVNVGSTLAGTARGNAMNRLDGLSEFVDTTNVVQKSYDELQNNTMHYINKLKEILALNKANKDIEYKELHEKLYDVLDKVVDNNVKKLIDEILKNIRNDNNIDGNTTINEVTSVNERNNKNLIEQAALRNYLLAIGCKTVSDKFYDTKLEIEDLRHIIVSADQGIGNIVLGEYTLNYTGVRNYKIFKGKKDLIDIDQNRNSARQYRIKIIDEQKDKVKNNGKVNPFNLNLVDELHEGVSVAMNEYILKKFSRVFKAIENKYSKEFFKNIIKNYDKMTEETREFYEDYVNVVKITEKEDEKETLSLSEASKKLNNQNIDEYRINLKKAKKGKSLKTQFMEDLPLLVKDDTGLLHSRNYKGEKESKELEKFENEKLLKDLYENIYKYKYVNNATFSTDKFMKVRLESNASRGKYVELELPKTYEEAMEVLKPSDEQGKRFGLDINKLIKERLLKLKRKKDDVPALKEDEEVYDVTLDTKWQVEDGVPVKMVNGKKIKYDLYNEESEKLLKKNCSASLVPKEQCRNFIYECLYNEEDLDQNQEITKCVKSLMNMRKESLEDSLKNEVDNMHPIIVIKILEKFGFKLVRKLNGDKKVQSWEDWVQDLNNKIDDKDVVKKARESDALRMYFKFLINYVNENPKLINKEARDMKEKEKEGEKQTHASRLGIESYKPIKERQELGMLNQFMKNNMARLPEMKYQNGKITGPFSQMTGGRMLLIPGAVRPVNKDTKDKYGSQLVKKLYQQKLNELKSRNKQLDKSTQQKIMKNIEQYQDAENKIIKLLSLIREYNKAVDQYGKYGNKSVSEEKMKDLVDSYERYRKLAQTRVERIGDNLKELEKDMEEKEQIDTEELFKV